MKKSSSFLALCVFIGPLIGALGCASFQQQAFNKGASGSVKRIAVLDAPIPREIRVVNEGGAAMGFGLIGAAVGESDEQDKTERFTRQVWYPLSTMGETMLGDISAELQKSGYAVTRLKDQVPVHDGDEDDNRDYSAIVTDADALLDVSFVRVWYVSPAGSSDYRPWLLVRARLISSKDRSRLYAQEFSYGGEAAGSEHPHFPSAPQYAYKNFDTLMEKADEAREGLAAGVQPIAMRIAAALR